MLAWLAFANRGDDGHDDGGGSSWVQRVLLVLAIASYVWLAGGLIAWLAVGT